MIACNWTKSYTVTPTTAWISGIYLAVLTNAQNYQSNVIFAVKDGRPAAFLFQQAVATYQAYNNWPDDGLTGKSLYTYNSNGANTVSGEKRAVKVSFDRPYKGYGPTAFFQWDIDFVRWIEKSGYDVTYTTDLDTHENGGQLLKSKAILSVGHDEYWSWQMFDAVQAARDQGVSLGFFSANGTYRQIRFEASAAGVADRVVVGYKSAAMDPMNPGQTTTVEYRIAPVSRPEQGLMGVMYCGVPGNDCGVNSNVDYVVTNSSNWVYANTGFRDGDHVPGIVGYEMDRYWSDSPLPNGISNRAILSQSPFTSWGGTATYANSSIYQASSGALVFAAGTVSWSWGLDNFWYAYADARIQQTTANILNGFLNAGPPPPPPPPGSIAFVQGNKGQVGNQSAVSVAYPSSNTQHNFLLAFVAYYTNTASVSLSDTLGNPWTPVDAWQDDGAGDKVRLYYVLDSKAGANTVTFSGAAGSWIGLAVAEYSGVALTTALDGAIHGTTSGSSSTPTGPAFTPTAGDLVVAVMGDQVSSTSITPTSPWLDGPTHQLSNANPNEDVGGEYQVNAPGTATSAGWSLTGATRWATAYAAFRHA
jgi:hypothetical protein